jgi:RNA polymerase sigma-70 factor (ECF subfamily)
VAGKEDDELAVLLRAAVAGDEKAYAAFLKRVAGAVRAFARAKIVKGGVDPEDIVQETLLAIHLKRHTWRTDAPVMPWVYAIARFKLVDAFRRRGSRMEIDLADVPDLAVEQETDSVSPRDIGRILETLAPGQRSVVAAISVEGCSIGETAQRLAMTETAVRVALHRGLAAIGRRFGQTT